MKLDTMKYDSIRMSGFAVFRGVVLPVLAAGLAAVTVEAGAAQSVEKLVISDKTLVAWVAPANLSQRGGSVLTLEKPGGTFDAMVFGEIAASRWMAGSNNFSRTQTAQNSSPAETCDGKGLVQIAIVYRGKQVTIYRNGVKYADYTVGSRGAIQQRQLGADGIAAHRRKRGQSLLGRLDRRRSHLWRSLSVPADCRTSAQSAVGSRARCLVGLRSRSSFGPHETVSHRHLVW